MIKVSQELLREIRASGKRFPEKLRTLRKKELNLLRQRREFHLAQAAEHQAKAKALDAEIKRFTESTSLHLVIPAPKNSVEQVVTDFLTDHPATLVEIANATGLKTTSISQVLQTLELRQSVRREYPPGRQRGAKYIFDREKYYGCRESKRSGQK